MDTNDTSDDELALVVGGTGIAGRALIAELAGRGLRVAGLSRRPAETPEGVPAVRADLTDPESLRAALHGLRPTRVFVTAWTRMPTEAENIAVNGAMVHNVLREAGRAGRLRHVALLTGLKHYLGPFEAYGTVPTHDTPFHEDEPRLPVDNFYYAQEDELFAAAEHYGFAWSVHRAHTIIGHAVGNAMNMGMTLGVYGSLCRAEGRPFVFPGSETGWNGVTDVTDAGLLARQMIWASTTDGLPSQAYNTTNGDVFRWRWLWPRLAELLGVEWEGYRERPRPLERQMAGKEGDWRALAERERLVEPDLARVASWWHTDGDMSRPLESFADMARSRAAGFTEYVSTPDAFAALFETLRRERVIPG